MHVRPNPAWSTGALLILGVTATLACQVPVFRYALERWTSDAYTLRISPAGTDGKLSAAEEKVVEFLQTANQSTEQPANLQVIVDTEAKSSAASQMELFYPQKIRGIEVSPIWSGTLTMENAQILIDSPARQEVAKRILAGESSTWVVVKSGHPEKDQTAAKSLAEALGEAKSTLRIPDGVVARDAVDSNFMGNPDNILRSEVPLKIDFSTLEIDRNDPAEAAFLEMLLNLESDLDEYADEPMVFPVFGRGRVLEPILGKGISRDNILDYAAYVAGACSCEVKDQNPGMDLLIAANWDAALEGSSVIFGKTDLPPLEGTAALSTTQAKGSHSDGPLLKPHFTTAEGEEGELELEVTPQAGSVSALGSLGIAAVAAILAIGMGAFILKRKKSS